MLHACRQLLYLLKLYGCDWPCLQSWTIAKCINVIFKNVHDCLYILTWYSCCERWNVETIMILTSDCVENERIPCIPGKFDRWGSVLSMSVAAPLMYTDGCQRTHDIISRTDKTFQVWTPLDSKWYIYLTNQKSSI